MCDSSAGIDCLAEHTPIQSIKSQTASSDLEGAQLQFAQLSWGGDIFPYEVVCSIVGIVLSIRYVGVYV